MSPALLAQARSLGYTTIQWNIDPHDWALPGAGETLRAHGYRFVTVTQLLRQRLIYR
jgi:peptidoglycan/xylan/chitin deacetylase (PgdA/CDA1 family)